LRQRKKRTRDIARKLSRAVIESAQGRKASILAVGDVHDAADGKRIAAKSQQEISL
jgi:hypothetical protein